MKGCLAVILFFSLRLFAGSQSDVENEVRYKRLEATPEKFVGKVVVIDCKIMKFVADRRVLDGFCDGQQTGSPCVYQNNSWICLHVDEGRSSISDYLIDHLENKPGEAYRVRIKGKMKEKKVLEVEEIRFCSMEPEPLFKRDDRDPELNNSDSCKPYDKILK